MAEEEIAPEIPPTLDLDNKHEQEGETAVAETTEEMELDTESHDAENGGNSEENGGVKRSREEEEGNGTEGENGVSKKQKGETSVEEKRLEELEGEEAKEVQENVGEEEEEEEEKEELKEGEVKEGEAKEGEAKEGEKAGVGNKKETVPVSLGPKVFKSSMEMFDYFVKLLHYWPPNVDVNKYEHMMLMDLVKKGHNEPEKKIGSGVRSFQVRFHPMWQSRCFFLVREDGFLDDFSFRKCIDKIIPLPAHMKAHSYTDNGRRSGGYQRDGGRGGGGGGGGGRGGRGGWRGRGRGRRGGFRK